MIFPSHLRGLMMASQKFELLALDYTGAFRTEAYGPEGESIRFIAPDSLMLRVQLLEMRDHIDRILAAYTPPQKAPDAP